MIGGLNPVPGNTTRSDAPAAAGAGVAGPDAGEVARIGWTTSRCGAGTATAR